MQGMNKRSNELDENNKPVPYSIYSGTYLIMILVFTFFIICFNNYLICHEQIIFVFFLASDKCLV